MKKNVLLSLIISLIINIVCLIINLISALYFSIVPLSITLSGGEVTSYIGFGIMLDKFYGLSDSANISNSFNISFHLSSFIIPFVIFFGITLIIKLYIDKKHKR